MKNWQSPMIEELNIEETAHDWFGKYRDGGYVGDGEISGHLSWTDPNTSGGNGGGNGDGNGDGNSDDNGLNNFSS